MIQVQGIMAIFALVFKITQSNIQQEQNKIEHKQRSKAEREAKKQRQFDLRQAKKKEKHRGH